MNVNNTNIPLSTDYSRFDFTPDRSNRKDSDDQNTSQTSVRADSFTLNMQVSMTTYNQTGRVQGAGDSQNSSALTYQSIKIEIQKQSFSLLMRMQDEDESNQNPLQKLLAYASDMTGKTQDPLGLGAYFASNPEDLKQIEQGIIPDYFNVENTGQRILDIWMGGYDPSGDVNAFVDNTQAMIGQAYDEIEQMLGGLPDVVNETRDWIMNQLEGLRTGQDPAQVNQLA